MLSSSLYSQTFTFQEVGIVKETQSKNDDFAPRIENGFFYWLESSGNSISKKSVSFPFQGSVGTVVSSGTYVDLYSASSIVSRHFQTEEYLTIQLFSKTDFGIESLPLFPELRYCSQPTVSPDGKTLFFVGINDFLVNTTDIFTSKLVNGKWQAPIVLGSKINSLANEITPFAISEDTLIFASNGLGGKGGFDLFLITEKNGKWADPIALIDLNSSANDSDPFVVSNGLFYFASDRNGLESGFDIFSSKIVQDIESKSEKITISPSTIEVYSGKTEDLITIPTVIPIEWLLNPPNTSSKEYIPYEEWKSSIRLLSLYTNQKNLHLSAWLPNAVSTSPILLTELQNVLKNLAPLIQYSDKKSKPESIVLTTEYVDFFRPIALTSSTKKITTQQCLFQWDKNEFQAVKWEISIATNQMVLRSVEGKFVPEENSIRLGLDSILAFLSDDVQALFCTVYLINSQSEVIEQTFTIPVVRTTIRKTGKSENEWNSFYSYYGEEKAKRTLYSIYSSSIKDAISTVNLVIEYVRGNEEEAIIFKEELEKIGKKVSLRERESQFRKGSGAFVIDFTLLRISFPK